jgi:cytoskeletal protein CcmA (bactofilin family)
MKTKLLLALVLALSLALTITPAFAQGRNSGGAVCFGGNTTIQSGNTVDGLVVFGCNATVQNGATVNGGTVVFGGDLTVENGAQMNGDVAVFGGSVDIDGNVRGDVAIAGGGVNLNSHAVVDGTVRVAGGGVSQQEGATVRGGISRENNFQFSPSFGRAFIPPFFGVPGTSTPFNGLDVFGLGLMRGLITALALAALGALLVVFFPQPTQRVMAAAQGSLGPSLGVGCLTLLVAPVLALLLIITLVGPFLLALVVAAAWILGWIAIGYLAGERMLDALKMHEIAPVLAVVTGVLVLAIIGQVPCLGWLLSLLIGTAGVGAVVLTRFGTRPYPYAPALVPAYPMGPMPPAPLTPAPAPTPPTPAAPTQTPPAEPNPPTETTTSGEGEPQI